MFTYSNLEISQLRIYKCDEKCHSANKRFEDKISPRDVLNALQRFSFCCAYCADKLKPNHWQLDHFFSRAMGGKNKGNNLAPACKWCNQMKNALDGNAFILKCKRVAERNLIDSLQFLNL